MNNETTPQNFIESNEYWERVSPIIGQIPYLGNISVYVYREEMQKKDRTYFEVSEIIKNLAYEHAEFLIQLRQNDPNSDLLAFINQGYEIDWAFLERLVLNERNRRDMQKMASEPIPVFELVPVFNKGDVRWQNPTLLADINKFLTDAAHKATSLGKGLKTVFDSKASAIISHTGIVMFGLLLDFASDTFSNFSRAISVVFGPEAISPDEQKTIPLTFILLFLELFSARLISGGIKDFMKGNYQKGFGKAFASIVLSVAILTGFANTYGFVVNSWPDLWNANANMLFRNNPTFANIVNSAGQFLVAGLINWGVETYSVIRGLLGELSDEKDNKPKENINDNDDNGNDDNGNDRAVGDGGNNQSPVIQQLKKNLPRDLK